MKLNLIDSHAHVQFSAFQHDADCIIENTLSEGIGMILPGTQIDTSRSAVALAAKYAEGVYATIGIHPLHLLPLEISQEEINFKARAENFEYETYKQLAKSSNKVVGIGECGLEYFRIIENAAHLGMDILEIKKKQHETYEAHIKLACDLGLPMITHVRSSAPASSDAYDDTLAILKQYPQARGVVHCFLGNWNIAKKFLDTGFSISFTGIITFTKDQGVIETVKNVPLTSFLVETDSPYLSPQPVRGTRNEPRNVRHIVSKIAEIKRISQDSVAEHSLENTLDLFHIQV